MKILGLNISRSKDVKTHTAANHKATHKTSGRSIGAARNDRLMTNWNSLKTIEQELVSNWLIRERARDLTRNNDFAQKFLLEFRTNVSGPDGFTFQSNVTEFIKNKLSGEWEKQEDEFANIVIEEAMKDFSLMENCSVDGTKTFRTIQDMAAFMWARDGEAFIRLVNNAKSKFGLQLQIIEAEAVDEFLNTKLANGHIVKMGVELDEWRKPVAYYVRKRTSATDLWGMLISTGLDHDIIPADEMIHIFDQIHPAQTRGISLLVQSMVRLKRLSDYEEAVLVNAEVAASKMGFFSDKTPENPSDLVLGGQEMSTDDNGVTTPTGDQQMDVSAGSFEDIGAKEFHAWNPEFPTAQHEMFVRSTMHAVTSGLGISYAAGTNDLGDTSFSSERVGLLDEREIWKLRQIVFAERFLLRFYPKWLKYAIMSGNVDLPISKLDKFNKPVWIGRRWGWVDPLKDTMADALAVEYGFKTRTQILAEKGYDIREVNAELKKERADEKKEGLSLKYYAGPTASGDLRATDATPAEGADSTDTQDASANKKKNRSAVEEQDDRILLDAYEILKNRKLKVAA